MPEKPGKKPTQTEQPKGMSDPTPKPTPTPHPEERDARGSESKSNMSLVVKIKGGKLRVYEPKLICEASWDGEFDIGFEALTVESCFVVESKLKFEKELCIRLYGYGLDYDSGQTIMGRRVAAHIGVGIYAIIGVNGEISIMAKIENVGDIKGGVMGNFWGVLVGVPSALPYAWYDPKDFGASIALNGKINAWAYVGPQLTLDILDFNLLTAQVWLGLEAEAVIKSSVGEDGTSLQLGVGADFVALFRAWLFNNPIKYYLVRLKLFEKTLQYETGKMVGGDSATSKTITPVIQVDGLCSYRDLLWGSVWYEDEIGIHPVANVPLNIIFWRNGMAAPVTIGIQTDSNGDFLYQFRGTDRLLPTDYVKLAIDHTVEDQGQTITYQVEMPEYMRPSIPFVPYILEADAFNDVVIGMVSPCKTDLPDYPEEEFYSGYVNINVYDENGKLIERARTYTEDGSFEIEFDDPDIISGGHMVRASLNFETDMSTSDYVNASIDSLDLIIDCLIDGVEASLVEEIQKSRPGQLGVFASNILVEGTVTNTKNKRPLEGNVAMSLGFLGSGWNGDIPLQVLYDTPDGSPDEDLILPRSEFKKELGKSTLGEQGRLITGIVIKIEYEGLIKRVLYEFTNNQADFENIVAGETNPVNKKIIEVIESKVHWPDIMISMGSSLMRVNGDFRAIDGRTNTSITMVGNELYVPIEAIVTALGGSVAYMNNKVTINLNNKSVVSSKDSQSITVNGKSSKMGAAAFMANDGTMMFPASFLSDTLGLTVEWDSDSGTLSIWSSANVANSAANKSSK